MKRTYSQTWHKSSPFGIKLKEIFTITVLTCTCPHPQKVHICQVSAIFIRGSLSCPQWPRLRKDRLSPDTEHHFPLPSAQQQTSELQPAELSLKHPPFSSDLALQTFLHDSASTGPIPYNSDSVERSQWGLMKVDLHRHVCVGGFIRKSDSTLWSG